MAAKTDTRLCPICGRVCDSRRCPDDGFPTVRQSFLEEATGDARAGEVFAERYAIERMIGKGGFGRVYLATQLGIDRPVALKTLHAEHLREPRHLRRFLLEAKSASRLSSPHVVRVYDFGIDDETGTPFLALEYLRGRTLTSLIARDAPLAPAPAAALLAQVCRALVDAGAEGIVHRDLKPDNIFLMHTREGGEFLKVMDFGIAKVVGADSSESDGLTDTGMAVGTPRYMAPEQVKSQPVDFRTDLYALGCILTELLTGAPPFQATDRTTLLTQHMEKPPPPLPDPLPSGEALPEALAVLHRALLCKEPHGRPASAAALLTVLEAVEAGREVDPEKELRKPARPTRPAMEAEAASVLPPTPAPVDSPTAQRTTRAITDPSTPAASLEEPQQLEPEAALAATSEVDWSPAAGEAGPSAKKHVRRVGAAAVALVVAVAVAALAWPGDEANGTRQRPPEAKTAEIVTQPATTAPEPEQAAPVQMAIEPPATEPPAPEPPATEPPEPIELPEPIEPPAIAQAPQTARLILKSKPAGALVYRGRHEICKTPCDLELPASDGPQRLRIVRKGYLARRISVHLAAGATAEKRVVLAAAKVEAPPPPREPKPPLPDLQFKEPRQDPEAAPGEMGE